MKKKYRCLFYVLIIVIVFGTSQSSNIKKSIFNEINSDLKIGDFNFDGKINESIYVNNIIGDITLMVNDDIENYKVDTANIIGSILINGKNNIVVNDGDKMISVKNKIGSVSVNF